jgi:sugar phosphate permease
VPASFEVALRRRAGSTNRSAVGPSYILLVLVVGTNLASPLYATYEARFHISALVVTLIVAAYAASVVAALTLVGPLADTFGPRRVVLPALALAAVGALLFAFADGAGWLFAARIVQGLAVGSASSALTAVLVMTGPSATRTRGSLLASAMTTGGAGLGPLVAGALAEFAPQPLRLSFFVEIGLLAVAAASCLRLPGRARDSPVWHPRLPRVPAAGRRRFALAGAVSFLAWGVAYIVLALAPSYVAARLRGAGLLVEGAGAGLLLICAAATQVGLRRWAERRAQIVGLGLLVAGLGGLVAAGFVSSMPLMLVTIAIAGAGQGLAFMGAIRLANDVAPRGEESGVAAAFWVASYLGGGLPVVGVGLLAGHLGLVAAVQIFAAGIAVACLVALVAVRAELPTA